MKPTFLFLLFAGWMLHAQPGTLDTTFGTNGKITAQLSTGNCSANTVLVQPDGKVIAAGYANTSAGTSNDFALARFNPDGSPDNSFNGNGKALVDFNSNADHCTAMVLQPDKKIIVAGFTFSDALDTHVFAIARLNVDGSLDTTFGDNGKVLAAYGLTAFCSSIALQPDGKILVAGHAYMPIVQSNHFLVARFNPDGSADESFGNNGETTTRVGNGSALAKSVAIQPDGKILLGGFTMNEQTWHWESALVRLNADGFPDHDFGDNGQAIQAIAGIDFTVNGMALQPDGKIVLAGYAGTGPSDNQFTLVRFLEDGTIDGLFADNGILISAVSPQNNQASTVLVDNGRIIVGGFANQGSGDLFALACYGPNGSSDPDFGNQGIALTDFSVADAIKAIALQPDRKIVAAGVSLNGSNLRFALARYGATVLATEDFSKNGSATVYPNPVNETSRLQFTLLQEAVVSCAMYDALGRRIAVVLDSENRKSGTHELELQANGLSSGTYYIKLSTPTTQTCLKILKI
jgi:uncharacterized delta-60 repeat protein